jgi:hypothetical protein
MSEMTEQEKAARVRKYYKREYKHGHIRWLLMDEDGTSVYCDQCGNIANFIHREILDGLELNVCICKAHARELLKQNPALIQNDLWIYQSADAERGHPPATPAGD